MKKLGVILFVFVLWASLSAMAQDTGTQSGASSQSSMGQTTTKKKTKLQHLTGKISDDGKTLTTDKDNKTYTIANPDVVKGHEGHDVHISGHVDPADNSIHVTSVKMVKEKASKEKGGAMSEKPPQ